MLAVVRRHKEEKIKERYHYHLHRRGHFGHNEMIPVYLLTFLPVRTCATIPVSLLTFLPVRTCGNGDSAESSTFSGLRSQ